MSYFNSVSLEEFKNELSLSSQNLKIKKSDLKKLFFIQAEKMEKFIRDKGLYDEFYENYVIPDIEIKFESITGLNDFYTGEFQRLNPLPDKSYNEYIKEHFNGDK